MNSLQQLERHHRSTPAGAVEAAIFVQPLCGDGNIACALAAENCFPWCMGVVRGGARAQNVTMFNAARWESHVLLPDVDCGVARDAAAREEGQCSDQNAGILVDMISRAGLVRGQCRAESMCTASPVAALVSSLVPLAALNSSNASELGLTLDKVSRWIGRGLRTTLAGDANADIMKPIIECLRERVIRGARIFMVKVKTHRGEPLNEFADTIAERARQLPDDSKQGTTRTPRLLYEWLGKGVKRVCT